MYSSFMIGWRYNPNTDLFELNAYGHWEGNRQMSNVLTSVKANEETTIKVIVKETYVEFISATTQRVEGEFQGKKYLINSWFGGQKTPPQKMSIFLR